MATLRRKANYALSLLLAKCIILTVFRLDRSNPTLSDAGRGVPDFMVDNRAWLSITVFIIRRDVKSGMSATLFKGIWLAV